MGDFLWRPQWHTKGIPDGLSSPLQPWDLRVTELRVRDIASAILGSCSGPDGVRWTLSHLWAGQLHPSTSGNRQPSSLATKVLNVQAPSPGPPGNRSSVFVKPWLGGELFQTAAARSTGCFETHQEPDRKFLKT